MRRLSTKLLSKAELPVYIESSFSMVDLVDGSTVSTNHHVTSEYNEIPGSLA
jgi:hypothetical protein